MPRPDHLDRFLRAVHRRWVAVRVVESIGLAVLGGCGLALLVLPVLLWRGEPALPVVLTATAIAALAGLIAGFVRRPNLMSAAAEADRQLELADLLSTALLTRERAPADPWATVVVATADARCRTLAPSAIIVNRLGGRAWGGIGLATALVLTLGLMSANPQRSAAVATAQRNPLIDADRAARTPPLESTRTPAPTARRQRDPSDHRDGEVGLETTDDTGVGRPNDPASPRNPSATDGGGGAGLATSPRDTTDNARPSRNPSRTASPTGPEGVQSGGGTSSSVTTAQRDETGGGSTAAASKMAGPTPAWRSPSWSADRGQALSAVRYGRVPDEYRDLVREYFDVESD